MGVCGLGVCRFKQVSGGMDGWMDGSRDGLIDGWIALAVDAPTLFRATALREGFVRG